MPIGKNAIKRVENNGYSKVESSAPDMENSTVIAKLDPQVEEKIVAPVEKKTRGRKSAVKAPVVEEAPKASVEAPKAPAKRKYVKKASEAPVEAPKAPAKRKYVKKAPAKAVPRVEVGEEMPYYLL